MVIRVVRMSFKEDRIQEFLTLFNETKDDIRNFDGCQRLDLLQDFGQEHIFTTYSYWRDLKALDTYRHSSIFLESWSKMKKLFAHKPMAFSCKKIDEAAPALKQEK